MSEKQNRPFYKLRVTQTVVCCRCAICSGV